MDLYALQGPPAAAIPLRQQHIAVALATEALFQLRRFGFSFDVITRNDLNNDPNRLMGYDLFINSSIRKS
jgi:hypothetical protein